MTRIAKTTGLPDRRGLDKVIHGDNRPGKRHPLYKIWAGILRRCNNPNENNYERYGGRGIKVCERWENYINFREDMRDSWQPGLSIERIDNNAGYQPDNCRWATRKEQCRNRRSNFIIEYKGERKSAAEWADVLGIPWFRFYQRITKLGWTIERAMSEPARAWAPGKKKAA
jgi:hypothetical protein